MCSRFKDEGPIFITISDIYVCGEDRGRSDTFLYLRFYLQVVHHEVRNPRLDVLHILELFFRLLSVNFLDVTC